LLLDALCQVEGEVVPQSDLADLYFLEPQSKGG
jgi:hypothetical protein